MVKRRLTQLERKQETRQSLLNSAAETFAELGFHGASVDRIAERAGYSKGAVYAHFKSKEELFLALLEQQIQSHINQFHEWWANQPSLDHLIENIDVHFRSIIQQNRTWTVLSLEFLLHALRNESVGEKWASLVFKSVENITEALESMIAERCLTPSLSAKELAWIILSLENGMTVFYSITGDQAPTNAYGKALQHILHAAQSVK
ncbi:TetR/AcrR family transcriptional regulator [Bacillus xiapuensis]|uniref:TetR/AcrR family transcriptional regulator n=1 Tax=Bacillus xiapuensis TaxID=2014075 RepID=UPI000C23364A|nr:TetR/AcrR family transcriptional regulator [Bacillus xiapuensis]